MVKTTADLGMSLAALGDEIVAEYPMSTAAAISSSWTASGNGLDASPAEPDRSAVAAAKSGRTGAFYEICKRFPYE